MIFSHSVRIFARPIAAILKIGMTMKCKGLLIRNIEPWSWFSSRSIKLKHDIQNLFNLLPWQLLFFYLPYMSNLAKLLFYFINCPLHIDDQFFMKYASVELLFQYDAVRKQYGKTRYFKPKVNKILYIFFMPIKMNAGMVFDHFLIIKK